MRNEIEVQLEPAHTSDSLCDIDSGTQTPFDSCSLPVKMFKASLNTLWIIIQNFLLVNAALGYLEFGDDLIVPTLERVQYLLIYFHRLGCVYCEKFETTFDYLLVSFNESDNFQILKTDGYENSKLLRLFDVHSFPSIYILDYQTKQIIQYEEQNRELARLVKFVQTNVPHLSVIDQNYQPPVKMLDAISFNQELENLQRDLCVVFTVKFLEDWQEYDYPMHFLQRLARGDTTRDYGIVDTATISDFEIIQTYGITNFPSLIYFQPDGSFKTYNINSQNHFINKRLNEESIAFFLQELKFDDKESGKWYANITALRSYQESKEFFTDNLPVVAFGFNFDLISSGENQGLEQDFEQLLSEISL